MTVQIDPQTAMKMSKLRKTKRSSSQAPLTTPAKICRQCAAEKLTSPSSLTISWVQCDSLKPLSAKVSSPTTIIATSRSLEKVWQPTWTSKTRTIFKWPVLAHYLTRWIGEMEFMRRLMEMIQQRAVRQLFQKMLETAHFRMAKVKSTSR